LSEGAADCLTDSLSTQRDFFFAAHHVANIDLIQKVSVGDVSEQASAMSPN